MRQGAETIDRVNIRGVRSRKKLTQPDPNPNPKFTEKNPNPNPNLIENMLSRVHDVIQLSGNGTHY